MAPAGRKRCRRRVSRGARCEPRLYLYAWSGAALVRLPTETSPTCWLEFDVCSAAAIGASGRLNASTMPRRWVRCSAAPRMGVRPSPGRRRSTRGEHARRRARRRDGGLVGEGLLMRDLGDDLGGQLLVAARAARAGGKVRCCIACASGHARAQRRQPRSAFPAASARPTSIPGASATAARRRRERRSRGRRAIATGRLLRSEA